MNQCIALCNALVSNALGCMTKQTSSCFIWTAIISPLSNHKANSQDILQLSYMTNPVKKYNITEDLILIQVQFKFYCLIYKFWVVVTLGFTILSPWTFLLQGTIYQNKNLMAVNSVHLHVLLSRYRTLHLTTWTNFYMIKSVVCATWNIPITLDHPLHLPINIFE